jgi:hypothetical protein
LERGGQKVKALALLLIVWGNVAFPSQVKVLNLKPQDVGTINTSVGYSTVIQLGKKPLNVVLGDQSSFRVEFINDSITVKPLKPGAKSNIFIFTESDRFNLTVRSGPSGNVDYVVRLKRVFEDDKQIKILNRTATSKSFRLQLIREVSTPTSRFVDFQIENLTNSPAQFNSELFRLVNGTKAISLSSLYIEASVIKASSTLSGAVSLSLNAPKEITAVWIGLNGKPLLFTFTQNRKLPGGLLHASK